MSDTNEGAAWNDGLHFLMKQCLEDSKRWFPNTQGIPFLMLALGGEVGECQNIVKKYLRGSTTPEQMMELLPEEIVDVLIYLCNLMGLPEFEEIDWMDIWYKKRRFNQERFSGN